PRADDRREQRERDRPAPERERDRGHEVREQPADDPVARPEEGGEHEQRKGERLAGRSQRVSSLSCQRPSASRASQTMAGKGATRVSGIRRGPARSGGMWGWKPASRI